MSQDRTPEGEVWWIYSPLAEPWAGLRIAHFGTARCGDPDGEPIDIETFFILGEVPFRSGVRIWSEVAERECWRKVEQIKVPEV